MKSKNISIASVAILFFLPSCCLAHSAQVVNGNGVTRLGLTFGKTRVVAIIKTKQLDIGSTADKIPKSPDNNCTYSRYPCSEVVNVAIIVNGRNMFVPRSSYCDWSDLNSVALTRSKKQFILTVSGGDAAESYVSKIFFDYKMIVQRVIEIPYDNNEVTEKTIYYKNSNSDM